ncbi:MAG TPA: DsbA family protein [Nitrosopumilus sp.]
MNKKGIVLGVIAIAIIAGVVSSLSASDETVNLDMTRIHGSVSTAMGSPILGDPSAPITIVEFGDYQCHQCKNWFDNTKDPIMNEYIETGKANLIFVDMAFLGRDSPVAAQASYCAEEQEQYWEYHNELYTTQGSQIDGWADKETLKTIAVNLDLNMELFEGCLDSNKYQKRVQYNTSESKSFGVRGTPTFLIVSSDGQEQKLVGAQPFSVFKQVLDAMAK